MDRQPVTSTQLSEVGYDEKEKTLEIRFQNGAVYDYYDVPADTYKSLLLTYSLGLYFYKNIKGVFRYAKVG